MNKVAVVKEFDKVIKKQESRVMCDRERTWGADRHRRDGASPEDIETALVPCRSPQTAITKSCDMVIFTSHVVDVALKLRHARRSSVTGAASEAELSSSKVGLDALDLAGYGIERQQH